MMDSAGGRKKKPARCFGMFRFWFWQAANDEACVPSLGVEGILDSCLWVVLLSV